MTIAVVIRRLCFFFFFVVSSLTPESAVHDGFSVEMIPVDSPFSPFYNPSDTFSSRIRQAAQRSLNRLQYLQSSKTVASAIFEIRPPVVATGVVGAYLMKLYLGSPGFKTLAVIDTGSDLIWAQCIPCDNCYPQSAPIFDPPKSSTYTNLDCTSSFCKDQSVTSCVGGDCKFEYRYNDGTFIMGDFANDTMTLDFSDGNNISFPVAFGCGHNDSSRSLAGSIGGGLVGLGRGSTSLISQLGPVAVGRFSYCLTDYNDVNSKSVMNFGLRAIVSGDGLVTTPIITVPGMESFYYLTLNDISVGSQKLNIPPGTFHVSTGGDGGLIIDSGSALTYLNYIGYDIMLTALKSAIHFPVAANPVPGFQFCYVASETDIINSFPDITFHFLGGDVIVGAWNIFVEVDDHACLTVMPISSGFSVYGNIVQQNFHVGYDIAHNTVSIAHADCNRI